MPVPGAIADRTRSILPITWDALSRDPRYGDALLASAIDTTEERIYGSTIDEATEGTLPLIVIDFIAKLSAIEIISAGIDFWMNQPASETATGTNESHTFVDRADKLADLRQDLLEETRRLWGEVAPLISFRRVSNAPIMRINTLEEPFLTPSPQEFPRPYRKTARS